MTSLMASDCPSHQVELEVPLMTSLMASDCPSHQVELEVPPDDLSDDL